MGRYVIISLCVFGLAAQCAADYYWRDWNGTVPRDAFLVTTDNRGDVYIAQGYIENLGLYVGHIFSGQNEIYINPTTAFGPVAKTNTLKVLCSANPSSLKWLPSNNSFTPEVVNYTLPVIGGVTRTASTNTTAPVYIGRFAEGNYTFVGNVQTSYYVYFSDNDSDSGSRWGAYSDNYDLLIQSTR